MNRFAQVAKTHMYMVVKRLLPLAHGNRSTLTPQWGQSTRRGAYSKNTARPHIGTNW